MTVGTIFLKFTLTCQEEKFTGVWVSFKAGFNSTVHILTNFFAVSEKTLCPKLAKSELLKFANFVFLFHCWAVDASVVADWTVIHSSGPLMNWDLISRYVTSMPQARSSATTTRTSPEKFLGNLNVISAWLLSYRALVWEDILRPFTTKKLMIAQTVTWRLQGKIILHGTRNLM